MLFGNDLAAKVQQLRNAKCVVQVVTNSSRGSQNTFRNKFSRETFNNSKHFLSNRGRGQYLPRHNNQPPQNKNGVLQSLNELDIQVQLSPISFIESKLIPFCNSGPKIFRQVKFLYLMESGQS